MILCRPPRRAMGPAGTVDGTIGRFLLPIGGGSAEVARKFYLLIKRSADMPATEQILSAIEYIKAID